CARFAARCAALYVELKCQRADAHALAAATVDVLRASPIAARRAVVESFTLEAIAEVKRLAPELRTAALFKRTLREPRLRATEMIARALACGADEVALQRWLVTERNVEAARAAGLSVVVWTVD